MAIDRLAPNLCPHRRGCEARTVIGANGGALDANERAYNPAQLASAVQDEVFPYELNYFREAGRLSASLERLDALWIDVSQADAAAQEDVLRKRGDAGDGALDVSHLPDQCLRQD